MTKAEVGARITATGLIPAIRAKTAQDAIFAANSVFQGDILIVELTMTVPGATAAIAELMRTNPDVAVGAGTVLDIETAKRCIDVGASFLTSTGLDLDIVEFADRNHIAVIPGAMTPTEVMKAIKAGVDFIKIFPCAQIGGPAYITALRAPFPNAALIASGGVNQQNAADYIRAGAVALGIGEHLVPHEAIEGQDLDWIRELSRRFRNIVQRTRQSPSK